MACGKLHADLTGHEAWRLRLNIRVRSDRLCPSRCWRCAFLRQERRHWLRWRKSKSKVFRSEEDGALAMLSAFATVAALVLESAASDICDEPVARGERFQIV